MLPIPFDNPATYVGHSGVDFGQPRGTAIRASGPGKVVHRNSNNKGGKLVWIQYDNTDGWIGYAHMDDWRDVPAVGTRVHEGMVIGHVGSSGNSTGPHLHIEAANQPTTAGIWARFDRNRIVGKGVSAPAFPLPAGWYFGPKSGPRESVSGYYSYREALRLWQARMQARGWKINPDGLYGNETRSVALAFQKEKGLYPDGLIGPVTWSAAWTLPVT